jgi:ABC-type glycerol-3-phosphate transport system substrate-binding protein
VFDLSQIHINRTVMRLWAIVLVGVLLGAGAGSAAKVKLTYMSWYTDEAEQAEMDVIEAFMEKYPDIEVEKIPGDPRSKLPVMVAGGAPPDVAVVGNSLWPQLELLALDITAAVQQAGISLSTFLPGSEPHSIRNGRWYGLPWGNGGFYLAYNRDHFDQAGLPYPVKGWTTEAFLEAAQRLTIRRDADEKPERWAIDPGFRQPYEPFLYAEGGRVIDPDTGLLGVGKPEYYNMLQFYADLYNVHRVATVVPGNSAQRRNPLIAGEISMLGDWMSGINQYLSVNAHEKINWCYAYWPTRTDEPPGLMSGHTIAAINGTKHPQEAIQFVLFWASQEAERILAAKALYPVTRWGIRTMAQTLRLPPGYRANEVLQPIIEPTDNYHTIPNHIPGYVEVNRDHLLPAVSQVLSGQKLAQQVMPMVAEIGNKILQEALAATK